MKKMMRILLCVNYLASAITVTIDRTVIDFAVDSGKVELECLCDYSKCPVNKVAWYRDGKRIKEQFGDGYWIISDRLKLTGTTRKSMGAYQCESEGTKSEATIVKNSSNEKIKIEPKGEHVVASGEPTKLTCESNAAPRLPIKWFKNDKEISDENYEIKARFDEGSSSLHFASVNKDNDAGEYTCCVVLDNGECQLTSKATTLLVDRATWLMRPESMVTGKPGQDVQIHCKPNADVLIVWSHDAENAFKLEPSSRFDDRVYVDTNGTLFINQVKETDSGKYICSYDGHRAESTLTVLSYRNQVELIEVYQTDSVSKSCPETSDDDSVTWFHNSKPVDNNTLRAKLLISSANVTHNGEWQCKHKNGSFYFNIKVNPASGIVPKQPNVTQQSGNILIAWDNAVPDAQQYTIIQFKSADDLVWLDLAKVDSASQYEVNSNAILEELPEAKQVVFRIAFTDGKKVRSEFSEGSEYVEVYNLNQLLVIVGGLSVAILLFFILTVLLVMRKCTDNHMKGSSRTKDFTYNKPYQTYDHTNQHNQLFLIRNGSDSGHGTHSSTSRHEIDNMVWNESPRLYHPKETLNSHKSSHHSAYNYNHSSTAHFQRNGIGEYAQIDILPVERRNGYDLRQEPIYESIDHPKP